MNKINLFYVFFLFLGSICGISALLLFLFIIPIEEIVSIDNVNYIYDKLSFHMFFLELIIVVVGLAAAFLGIIGYQSIREEAVRQAVRQAEDEAKLYFETVGKQSEQPDTLGELPHNGSSKPEMENREVEER